MSPPLPPTSCLLLAALAGAMGCLPSRSDVEELVGLELPPSASKLQLAEDVLEVHGRHTKLAFTFDPGELDELRGRLPCELTRGAHSCLAPAADAPAWWTPASGARSLSCHFGTDHDFQEWSIDVANPRRYRAFVEVSEYEDALGPCAPDDDFHLPCNTGGTRNHQWAAPQGLSLDAGAVIPDGGSEPVSPRAPKSRPAGTTDAGDFGFPPSVRHRAPGG